MRLQRWTIAAVLSVALCAGTVWAQGFGTISGAVTDPTGAAVAGATVVVKNLANAQVRTVQTNQSGFYVVESLNPAAYTVSVEEQGFKTNTRSNVALQVSQSLTLDFRMQVGEIDQQVTVEAEGEQVDTTTPTLKEVVDPTRITSIPLNGRNAAMLTTLVSGAVISPSNNADQGNAKTFPAAVPISVNGTRENQTGYWLDGAPNIDFFSNINQPFPFPDALQEFSVQTSNYTAEYGQDAGGVVSIVTKSGTNQFHGSAFEFLRNRVFNARNYFATSADPLKRNQFGGTVGGPIRHDRTFFFGGYQGTRIRSSQNGQSAFVPTDANRAGDFTAYLSASDPDNPLGRVVILPAPFVNNKINPSQFDPASVKMLNFVPHAQGNGFVSYTTPIIQNFDEYILRGDHTISSNDKLVGRYYYDRFYNVADYGGSLLAYRQGSTISSHNAMIEEQHQFSPNMLNDFVVGFMRIVSIRQPPASTPDVADFGVPIYQPTPKAIQSISITGYFSTGANPTAKFPRTGYSYIDNFHWVHGNHNFAFGVMYERDSFNMVNVLGLPGTFSFSGDSTGNALADFMLGDLRTFGQANGQHVKNRLWTLNEYFEDSWRVSKRLALSYGVRYEPTRQWNELYHQSSVFYADAFMAGTHSAVFPNAPPGLFYEGDPRVPSRGIRGDYHNIAPRLGFAWDVLGNGRTSLRGGVGVFYDSRIPALSNNRILGEAPFSATVSLTTPKGPFSNPYLGVPNPFPAVFPPASSARFVPPVQVFSWDPSGQWNTPRTYMMNLAIEQDLGKGLLMRMAYVGSRGQYETVTIDQNPAQYIPGCSLSTDQRRRYNDASATCVPAYTPQLSNIYTQSNSGNSWYHSGQFSLTKPMSHGITLLANYTWSRSTDNLPFGTDAATFGTAGYYTLPVTAPDFRRYDRGLSDFNHSHVFVTSYVWQTPSLGKMRALTRQTLGNWEFSGIFSAETGAPLALYTGTDRSNTGIGKDRPVLLPGVNPYAHGSCATASTRSCVGWLNPAAFTLPAIGSFGNVGKGQFTGPGYWDWDMGVFKDFPVTERYSMQFRGELFNSLNHTNFMDDNTGSYAKSPVQTYTGAGFGKILAANDPRIIQLALKVVF